MLTDKTIVLGVTGSIAAYKAVDIASRLTKEGARVEVDARYRVLGPLLALRIRVEREEQGG